VQTIAVRTMGNLSEAGFSALTEETDMQIAGQAIPPNLKLLEVMLKSDPENETLLALLAQGYTSYALGWVEDTEPERARVFYVRARDFGLRIINQNKKLARALEGSVDEWTAALAQCDKDAVPGVFWTALGWGSYLNITLTDPDAVAAIPKIEAMMQFVANRDYAFYFASADMFLGALYGSRPRMLGGDPDKSRMHFEKALQINGGKFLMTQVYYARSYAVQTQNEALFEELLNTVDRTSVDVLPEFRLANQIAKNKGKLLMARKGDLF
jgi:Asp-tRNA(Asn)/Glu-tRNA(Gln) amidotransferase A subunit family amidase